MSRAVILLFLFFVRTGALDVNNRTASDPDFENMQTMQKFEEAAKQQWDQTSRRQPPPTNDETDKLGGGIELFTWFPWFQKSSTVQTVKAILKRENDPKLVPVLGVGSWHEITIYGKKKESNATEEPDASALSENSAPSVISKSMWFLIYVSCIACLLLQ